MELFFSFVFFFKLEASPVHKNMFSVNLLLLINYISGSNPKPVCFSFPFPTLQLIGPEMLNNYLISPFFFLFLEKEQTAGNRRK